MKGKYVLLASAFLISGVTFAQKDELKAAEKALKNGDAAGAKTSLQQAEGLIANADDSQKAQFYFLKGNAGLELAKKKVDEGKNLQEAAKAYNELLATEKKSGKAKFSKQAETSLGQVKGMLFNQAVADQQNKKFRESALKLYDVYQLDKKDTLNLFNAASAAVMDEKDYDLALGYYEELKKLGFTGKGKMYFATETVSQKESQFNSKAERDLFLKSGYEKPREEVVESKLGEIYRNYALILVQKGQIEEAKKAISDARKANPKDETLASTEANLYLQTKDYETYKALVLKDLEKNPNSAVNYYNLGVITSTTNAKESEEFYKKAIALDPKYMDAYLNLAALKLAGDTEMVAEMQKLGTSAKDNKRYEELKAKREKMFKEALPFLEKAVSIDAKNQAAYSTLLNVYNYLEMTSEAKALKAKNAN